jgi:hypothetical protein
MGSEFRAGLRFGLGFVYVRNAMQASVPHGQKAAEANGELLELTFELRERDSELSDIERAAIPENR